MLERNLFNLTDYFVRTIKVCSCEFARILNQMKATCKMLEDEDERPNIFKYPQLSLQRLNPAWVTAAWMTQNIHRHVGGQFNVL